MFSLSVVDHIRLDFGHVAQNYTVHAEAAERLAGHILKVRIAILVLVAMTVIAAVAALLQPAWNFDVSVAIASSLALATYVAQSALGLEGRVQAHRTCAHRLWLIAEGYRSLLTELQDGLIDPSVLLRRRDQLIERVHAAYDQVFPTDQRAFESVRLNGSGGLTDETIDRWLPESLRRGSTRAA
jgi:SMODS and SLOG-associating 2TM effector domain family 4